MDLVSLWGGGFGLPESVALAAVAVIGYVFGRGQRKPSSGAPSNEVVRATEIARQLEAVAAELRSDLATHRAEVERFKQAVRVAGASDDGPSLLGDEADRVLEPTLRLVSRVASAYDQIRRQSTALALLGGGRTDTLTGLGNSRALSELLRVEIAGHSATGGLFSIAVLGVHARNGSADSQEGATRLLHASELLRPQLRDTDVLARYGIDELVVVMPHTRLYGACVFARRAAAVLGEAGVVASCGLAQSAEGDTAASLLGRADSALYSARAKAPGTRYLHNGQTIRQDHDPSAAALGAELAATAS